MKLTAPEQEFIANLERAGGSWCPPAEIQTPRAFQRLARRLENIGIINIEPIDVGYRYSLNGEADG